VARLDLSFGVGILWSRPWPSPSGHSQPQIVRPRITPKIGTVFGSAESDVIERKKLVCLRKKEIPDSVPDRAYMRLHDRRQP